MPSWSPPVWACIALTATWTLASYILKINLQATLPCQSGDRSVLPLSEWGVCISWNMTIMFPLRVLLVTVTKAFAPPQKSYQAGLLFTHKDDCGGAISVTERYRPIGLVFPLHPDTKSYIRYNVSLRSKRFRLVSEQRKTEERDSRFWPREKWNKSQKLLFYLRHFSRGLWLSLLVLCS